MQQSGPSRKRAAPGASPLVQQQAAPSQPSYQYTSQPQISENTDFSNFDFSQPIFPSDQGFSGDSAMAEANNFAASNLNGGGQASNYGNSMVGMPQSTDLVRRAPRNQQLGPPNAGQGQEDWNGGAYSNNTHGPGEEENEQELDMKVAMAKRDAQGKRKQIPPFVQKLSSFLDSSHTDLIRWSDDGRSFIVLDEDEFARTLIPELFKHNNYASFVRQLNMYGFHKTVNITDGSLRQSEKARKGVKPPSMYSHPYFRKNRPDLLWLIQKPSTKTGAKRKREGALKDQYESDEERQFSPVVENRPQEIGAPATTTGSDLAALPRNELNSVRKELQKLQNQQRFISQMISQLKEQNDAFYRQATTFQALHDRHENSINAILTFLATFYNRSLDGQGAQNLVNMFSNQGQNNQQQGSVVEEYQENSPETNNQLQRYVKRPQLLLPGPAAAALRQQQPGGATTMPNSARASVSPPDEDVKSGKASSATPRPKLAKSASPVVKTDAPTPDMLNQVPDSSSSDQMMSLINNINSTNASSTPGTTAPAFDFSSALDHYQNANGNSPLTPQQRDDMLALMANQQGQTDGSNAMVSPQPPAMPDLSQLKETQQQLEMLTNMQRQQNDKVQELNRRLQPLSPTGAIPGLPQGSVEEYPFDMTGAPGDYDPNAFIDFDNGNWDAGAAGNDINFDFTNNDAADGGNIDWDFGNTGAGDMSGGGGGGGGDMFQTGNNDASLLAVGQRQDGSAGRIESVSSEATSPAVTVTEDPGTPNNTKRQKRS